MIRHGSAPTWSAVAVATALALPWTTPALRAQEDTPHPAHAASPGSRLGVVAFASSGARAARVPFLRGIALLHSFEYEDAAAAFQQAERADSSFALPYWFEAFTHSHLLWGEDDPAAARAVLARLAPTPEARLARAPTARERSYGAAIEAFFADTTPAVRTRGFADTVTALATREPADLEAAAFAALGTIMALSERGYPPEQQQAAEDRAIALASRVFRAEPNHPGAAHYLIHVADLDPAFAQRALPAARAYARIAPDAEHAQHMPSHVFVPLGLWDDVIASNERSWAASREWAAKHGLSGAAADFHSLGFLEYAYLQAGRWRAARALLDTARAALAGADLSGAGRADARYALSALAYQYAGETGRWSDAVDPPATRSPANAREAGFALRAERNRFVMTGLRGDTATLARGAAELRARADAARTEQKGVSLYALGLEALLARARGERERALDLLARAGAFEDGIPPIGPLPFPVARELRGELLLAAGKPGDAAEEYERVLARAPNRSSALLGLARARAAARDGPGAADAYRRLLASWHAADADLPALAEVRRGAEDGLAARPR